MYYTYSKLIYDFFVENCCAWKYTIMDRTTFIAFLIITIGWNIATECVHGKYFWQKINSLSFSYASLVSHSTQDSVVAPNEKYDVWVNIDAELWCGATPDKKKYWKKIVRHFLNVRSTEQINVPLQMKINFEIEIQLNCLLFAA